MSLMNVSNPTAYTSQVAKQSNEVTEYKYGKIIGRPNLSEKAQKYYEELKSKHGDMDFILVGKDMKDSAMDASASYKGDKDTVVIVDEETIEKMAADEDVKAKYEKLLDDSKDQLDKMRDSILKDAENGGANVKTLGIRINGDGTSSFFAVMEKNNRSVSEKVAEKREAKKAEAKVDERRKAKAAVYDKMVDKLYEKAKARRDDRTDRLMGKKDDKAEYEVSETVTVKADSAEGLLKAIKDVRMSWLADEVRTPEEKMLGQSIDFRG